MASDDDRQLDLAGVLAELHGLVGRVVIVESAAEGRAAFQTARGLLAGAIDTQIDLARSPSRPAIIAFYLAGEGVEAGFTLREHELREARAYEVPMADGARARHLQVLLAGGAELLIAEDWNTEHSVPEAA